MTIAKPKNFELYPKTGVVFSDGTVTGYAAVHVAEIRRQMLYQHQSSRQNIPIKKTSKLINYEKLELIFFIIFVITGVFGLILSMIDAVIPFTFLGYIFFGIMLSMLLMSGLPLLAIKIFKN